LRKTVYLFNFFGKVHYNHILDNDQVGENDLEVVCDIVLA